MNTFAVVLKPPGQTVSSRDVAQLLEPLANMGAGKQTCWLNGRIGIGIFSACPRPHPEDGQPRIQDPSERYLLVADARLDDRENTLGRLGLPRPDWKSCKDAEIILAAYLKWGRNCCAYLSGDYCFVVFDLISGDLFAATDPVGVHRLFYVQPPAGGLVIGSDEACALAYPTHAIAWNRVGVALWLSAAPHRELSLLAHIRVLACGNALLYHDGVCRIRRWWAPELVPAIRYRSLTEYSEHYRRLLQDVVADHLRGASGAVACELSGGMDSTSIAVCAAQVANAQGLRLTGISALFPGDATADESTVIDAVCKRLPIAWSGFDASRAMRDSFPFGLIAHPASLHAMGHPLHQRILEIARSRSAETILNGLGGDELTTGRISWASLSRLRRGDLTILAELGAQAARRGISPRNYLWNWVGRPLLGTLAGSRLRLALRQLGWIGPRSPRHLVGHHDIDREIWHTLKQTVPAAGLTHAQHDLLIGLRQSNGLPVLDAYRRTATRHGVRVRSPFFDLRLIEFALATPPDVWWRDGFAKWLPRMAMRSELPEAVVLARTKTDFGEPMREAWRLHQGTVHLKMQEGLTVAQKFPDLYAILGIYEDLPDGTISLNDLYALLLSCWVARRFGSNPT